MQREAIRSSVMCEVASPQFASAVLTAKAAFMEVLFVGDQRLHGVNPLPTRPAQFGLWNSNFLQHIEENVHHTSLRLPAHFPQIPWKEPLNLAVSKCS